MNGDRASSITTYFQVCDGVRVRFADTRTDSDTVVLMLAPSRPSSKRRAWRWCERWTPERTSATQSEGVAGRDAEPEVHEDYVSAYDLGRFAESARFVRHYQEQNPVLRDLLPTINTPAQIVAGHADEIVPWSNNQYLGDLLPNSELHPLDAGHFAWEEAPEEYGRLIVEWIEGGYHRLQR